MRICQKPKLLSQFGLVLICALPASLWAQNTSVPTRIDAVTVYTSGATVVRTGQVQVPAGSSTFAITGLSEVLDVERIQVQLAAQGIALSQVSVDEVPAEQAINTQVTALQDQINSIQGQLSALTDSTATAQLELRFLEGISQGYAKESWFEGARGNADVSSWRGALTVLRDGSSQAQKTVRDNTEAARTLNDQLSRLQRELRDLRGKRRGSLTVTVAVNASAATSSDFRLSYFQEDAGWTSQYVAQLDSEQGQLELVQKAVISQETDEAWNDVALRLSTSEPSGELEAPEVNSEFLDLFDPALLTRSKADRTVAMASRRIEEVVVTASRVTSEVSRFAVNYQVPGRVNVINNADENQTFDLTTMQFAPNLVTTVVPRESEEAFLVAKFENDQNVPLYASSMQVFVDQTYVGEVWFETALPGEQVTLPVGQDRRVKVVARNLGGAKAESGLISRRKLEGTNMLFEISNQRAAQTLVEVYDRYPKAIHDDIEVRVPREATAPTETDVDDLAGVVLWRKSLQANETWRIKHQYEVTYPADKTLQRQ